MASLTVRQLDDKLKTLLRLRAARHGRSMEDEVRVILKTAVADAGRDVPEQFEPPSHPTPKKALRAQPDTRRVLLIIGGGIAAYKALDLIRRLQDRGLRVRCVLTHAAQHFVTALAAGALAGERVYTDLFDAQSEFDVGHIRLARDTDLIVVAPATADLLAKMAGGHADDLASAVLLATDKPILLAPAMNPRMWSAKATQRNLAQLGADGVHVVGPNGGEMAERGEAGLGRMAEPMEIAAAAVAMLRAAGPLSGRRVLVTSGPTHEPIDPVRFIANRSSGKQGHAIAAAAAAAGAAVTLVSGPVEVPDPPGVTVIKVETARQMLEAVEKVAARRRCGVRGRSRRLARRAGERQQDQKAGRPAATARPDRESRHPGDDRAPQVWPAAAGHRFCRRDRRRDRQRQGEAGPQGLRLDFGQRRVARDRHHGRRQQHGSSGHRRGR